MKRDDDDGRVIYSMEALDAVSPRRRPFPHRAKDKAKRGGDDGLTKDELRWLMGGAVRAALAVGLIFAAALVIFVLFCTKVWFR